jgi:hypothetical protein
LSKNVDNVVKNVDPTKMLTRYFWKKLVNIFYAVENDELISISWILLMSW